MLLMAPPEKKRISLPEYRSCLRLNGKSVGLPTFTSEDKMRKSSKRDQERYKFQAYLEGIKARKANRKLSDNPYDDELKQLWNKGWKAEDDCLVAGI
jgi:hypothetical protein